MSYQTKLFINNEFVDSISGKKFKTINPSTGEVICEVSEADKADVDVAVKAARKAFQSWRIVNPSERTKYLMKMADLLEQNLESFAALESLDNGKPIKEARGDVGICIDVLRYYGGWADKLQGSTIPVDGDYLCYTVLDPVGVCGAIIPWNFPLYMAVLKIAPAIACGNTVVVKTAEQTPLSALKLCELFLAVKLPPGVVNVLSGYGPTAGAALSNHMDVDKIAFTGSTEVGKLIQKASAETNLKRVTLELGGKSPLIIFDDADLEEAVNIAHNGIFFNQGQVCCASSRIYVQEGIYDKFIAKSVEFAKKRKVGNPLEETTEQGPQVDAEQFDRIMKYIDIGKKEGANMVCGGNRIGDKGYFIEPTIFSEVSDSHQIGKDEIFGPVLSVFKFKTAEEAIKRAHKTHYGLGAGVLSKNINTSLMVAHALRAGTVWVNNWGYVTAKTPFGGFKQSGYGRELGPYGLRQYTEVKTITIKVPKYTGDLEDLQ